MEISQLEKEDYNDFIDAVVKSFSKDYMPLGISKENAKSNGAFFTKSHLCNYINKGVKFFVLKDGRSILAGVGILEEDDYCKIKKLYVDVNHQGKGYGKVIMNFVESYARKQSIKRIKLGMVLENEKLHSFYENLGYIDNKISYNKKMKLNIAFMEKKL